MGRNTKSSTCTTDPASLADQSRGYRGGGGEQHAQGAGDVHETLHAARGGYAGEAVEELAHELGDPPRAHSHRVSRPALHHRRAESQALTTTTVEKSSTSPRPLFSKAPLPADV